MSRCVAYLINRNATVNLYALIPAGCCTPYPYEQALQMLEVEEEVCGVPVHNLAQACALPYLPEDQQSPENGASAAVTPTFRTPWLSPRTSAVGSPLGSPRRDTNLGEAKRHPTAAAIAVIARSESAAVNIIASAVTVCTALSWQGGSNILEHANCHRDSINI